MEFFKGDDTEKKYYESGKPLLENLLLQKELFFDGAYESYPFGDMLYTENRTPLSYAIVQDIFRISFPEIFTAFTVAGSFESYLTVFRKVFGEDVEVEFTVPAPGKLNIDIIAQDLELSDFVARRIESNEYIFDEVIDDESDNIVFQTVKGFETQYELEQMLHEMVPAGIYTEISLTFGG